METSTCGCELATKTTFVRGFQPEAAYLTHGKIRCIFTKRLLKV